jgi:predicted DNA-binding protein (UPF0251 family)
MGRKSKYNPERIEAIMCRIFGGKKIEDAVSQSGISKRTFHNYINQYPEMRNRYKKLLETKWMILLDNYDEIRYDSAKSVRGLKRIYNKLDLQREKLERRIDRLS